MIQRGGWAQLGRSSGDGDGIHTDFSLLQNLQCKASVGQDDEKKQRTEKRSAEVQAAKLHPVPSRQGLSFPLRIPSPQAGLPCPSKPRKSKFPCGTSVEKGCDGWEPRARRFKPGSFGRSVLFRSRRCKIFIYSTED